MINKIIIRSFAISLILIGVLSMIGLVQVSAFEFDNAKTYDSKTRTVTVKNAYGLGSTLAEIKLDSELVEYVNPGQDVKVAEFTIDSKTNYENAIIGFKFINNFNGKEIQKEYTLKYKVYENVSVRDKELVCELENRMIDLGGKEELVQACTESAAKTYHTEQQEKWVNFDKATALKEEIITIGIFVDTIQGENVEWIPTMYGIEINEWANWITIGFDTSLSAGWGFDNIPGIKDEKGGLYNLTTADIGSTSNNVNLSLRPDAFGNANNAIWKNLSTQIVNSTNLAGLDGWTEGTYYMRINVTKYTAQDFVFMGFDPPGFGNGTGVQIDSASGNLTFVWARDNAQLYKLNTSVNFTSPQNKNKWMQIVTAWNTSGRFIYRDGVLLTSDTIAMNTSQNNAYLGLGYSQIETNEIVYDEIRIYNRALTLAEIILLNNTRYTIILTSPSSNSVRYLRDVTFSGYIDGASNNATLFLYDASNNLVNNSVNTTITEIGGVNYSYFTVNNLNFEKYTWNILFCGSSCNFAVTNNTFNITQLQENSRTYNANVAEGTTESFVINVSYSTSDFSSANAYLFYNNTNYPTTRTSYGTSATFSTNIITPVVSSDINKTFFWKFELTNSTGVTYINTTSSNQTVSTLTIDNCSSNSFNILNFTTFDEDARTHLNSTAEVIVTIYDYATKSLISSYNNTYSITEVNSAKVCTNILPNATLFSMYYTAKYYSNVSLYALEYKNVQNAIITNNSAVQNVNLYDLLLASSTSCSLNVQGSDLLTLSGAVIDIQRQYVGLNQYLSVEAPLTDSNGNAFAHLVAGNAYYNIIISKDGAILGTINNLNPTTTQCASGYVFALGSNLSSVINYKEYGNVRISYNMNKVTRIFSMSFTSTDSNVHNVSWTVTKNDGYNNDTICQNEVSGTSGTLTCSIPTTYGNSSLIAETFSDGSFVGRAFVSLSPDTGDIFGGTRIILGLLMYSTLILFFLHNPILAILGAMLGMGSLIVFHIVDGGSLVGNASIFLWFVLAGGILIHYMRNRV